MARSRKAPATKAKSGVLRTMGWSGILGAFGLFALVAGVGAGYHHLSQPGRLPLRVVEVKGELQHLTHALVRDTASAAIDGGFFTCDMQRLRAAILAMAWVDDVSIRRVWPDKLSMTVTEHVPLARWGDDGLIDVRGHVFRPDSTAGYESLVRLHGPEGSERRVVEFFQSSVAAARLRDLQIRSVELDQRRHWWMVFEGGLTVSLGREDERQRLAQFLRVYPSLVADPQHLPERVDMRYAHGFAVRWRDNEDAKAAAAANDSREKV